MLVIGYPKCSTVQKAKKWLDENGYRYEERNIKEEPPTYEELKAWHQMSGLPIKRLFNTSGLVYKSMGLKDKLPDMGEQEQLELLASDGMLVKRPIVIQGDTVLVGFKPQQWDALKKSRDEKLEKMWNNFKNKAGIILDKSNVYKVCS